MFSTWAKRVRMLFRLTFPSVLAASLISIPFLTYLQPFGPRQPLFSCNHDRA